MLVLFVLIVFCFYSFFSSLILCSFWLFYPSYSTYKFLSTYESYLTNESCSTYESYSTLWVLLVLLVLIILLILLVLLGQPVLLVLLVFTWCLSCLLKSSFKSCLPVLKRPNLKTATFWGSEGDTVESKVDTVFYLVAVPSLSPLPSPTIPPQLTNPLTGMYRTSKKLKKLRDPCEGE